MKQSKKNDIVKKTLTPTLLYAAAAFFALFALWGAAYALVGNPFLVPSLKDTFFSMKQILAEKQFYVSYFQTFSRVFQAFFISFVPALTLAVAAYLFPPVRKTATVFVSALRSLPTMAVLLMILVWSTPKKAPVIVSFLALFPLLYTGVLSALFSVDERYKSVCTVFNVPLYKQIFRMYLPQILPPVLRESAGALSFSMKLVVSAEIMSNTFKSVGGLMQDSKIYLDMPRLFALTLIVILTGLILETFGNLIALAAERSTK